MQTAGSPGEPVPDGQGREPGLGPRPGPGRESRGRAREGRRERGRDGGSQGWAGAALGPAHGDGAVRGSGTASGLAGPWGGGAWAEGGRDVGPRAVRGWRGAGSLRDGRVALRGLTWGPGAMAAWGKPRGADMGSGATGRVWEAPGA